MKARLHTGSAIFLAVISQPVWAQDTAGQVKDTADARVERTTRPSGGLDEIIVTAQRKEESLQKAAIPINAATGEDLLRVGVVDSTALNKVAPALYVSSGGGANAGYFIRGVGNFTNNGYTSPAVAFNIDGVYIGRPSSTIASFLDVAVVEVLKGPQGTLYGRNATGGAINVIPTKPKIGENSGYLTAGYGNYDAYSVEGAINIAIAEEGAVRIAASYNTHDGYNSDGTNDAKDFAIRGQLYTELTDDINVRFSMDYSTQKGVGAGTTINGNYVFQPPFVPGRNSNPVPGWAFNPAPDNVSAPYTGLHTPAAQAFAATIAPASLYSPLRGFAYPYRNDRYFGTNAELNFDLGAVKFVLIPAYRRSELDNQFNGPPFKAAINQDTAEQFSVEARLSGAVGPLDWILGGYFFDETVKGKNSFNQFGTVSHNRFDSNVVSKAVFGRATYNVTDSLRLVGGIRYTDEKRSIDAFGTATTGVCREAPVGRAPFCPQVPTFPVGLTLQDTLAAINPALFTVPGRNPVVNFNPNGPSGIGQVFPYGPQNLGGAFPAGPGALLIITPNTIKQKASDSKVTYRAAVEYDVTPDNLVYVSFENGFRSGGFNLARGLENYAPEFIDAYTIGSKNRFFNNRLQLNLEAFYWKYKGQQLAALGVDIDGNNAFYTRNVGASTIKGVDIDFQFLATETTRIRGGVQYLDAKYDSYRFNQTDLSSASDPANFLLPITTCKSTQILTPRRSFDIDCSGKQALNSPKWTINGGIEQVVEFGDMRLTGSLDGRYRGSREVGFNYIPEGRVPGDFTMDAALTLGDFDKRWSLTAYVRNLTDKAVATTVQLGSGNIVGSVYEPPRTYGLRAKVSF